MRPGRLTRLLAAVALAGLGAVVGCGGAQFDGTTFQGNGIAFRVGPTPPTWRRIEVSHTALAFRDDGRDATVAVNGRCGADGEDVPLTALTQHLFLAFTEREILEQKIVPLDGRE